MATATRVNSFNTKPRSPVRAAAATSKTVAAAPVVAIPVKTALVHTATLIRGKTYVYKSIHFKNNVPQVVTREMADFLRDQYHEVTDADGELIEKPYFDVQYDVEAPVEERETRAVHRLPARPKARFA